MKENIILEEQVIQGFTEFEGGLWVLQVPSPLSPFTEGATYRVLWGETYFTCIATDFDGVIALGNLFLADSTYEDTREPFLSCVIPAEASGNTTDMLFCVTTDEGSSHRAGITQLIEEDIPDNTVKLKGYSGRETNYADVPKIWLDAPESTAENPVLVPFTYGEAIEGVEILPDFSSGDQTISMPKGYLAHSAVIKKPENLVPENVKLGETIAGIPGTYDPKPETESLTKEANFLEGDMRVEPTEGKYLSGVTIKKPQNLIPSNIAKDVEIAGIYGTLTGGDGDFVKNPIEIDGYYTAVTDERMIIEHNLGLMPDIIMVTTESTSAGCFVSFFGMCDDLLAPSEVARQRAVLYGSVNWLLANGLTPIEGEDDSGFGYISNASPESFEIGGSLFKHITGVRYNYKVIGGLIKRSGYFCIELLLDGIGNLTVTNGVAAIETLDIYLDGVYAKTVDYIHGDTFEIDISDVAVEFKPYTVSVIAAGSLLEENYPHRYCKDVTGWVAPNTEDAVAYGTCGTDVRWKLEQDGVLIIAGFGAMNGLTAGAQPWFAYKDKITSVRVLSGVTSIGANFVREHSNIVSVEIADTVKTIGSSSFRSCTGITSVVIPDSVTLIDSYAFRDCLGLGSVVIGNGVTTIELYAFHTCSALKTVTMGNNVQTINYRAFQACAELMSIVIPATLTLMGDNVFYGCNKLTSATFKDTTTWKVYTSQTATSGTTISSSYLANASTAATYLRSTYVGRWWKKT